MATGMAAGLRVPKVLLWHVAPPLLAVTGRAEGAEFGHQGSVSLLNITQTHFVHRVGAEFGHQASVSLLNITQTHFVHRGAPRQRHREVACTPTRIALPWRTRARGPCESTELGTPARGAWDKIGPPNGFSVNLAGDYWSTVQS